MEIKLLRHGPAHSFGWQRRRTLDQPNLVAWEDCEGKIHYADRSAKTTRIKIGKRFTLSPTVYEYRCPDGRKQVTFIKAG